MKNYLLLFMLALFAFAFTDVMPPDPEPQTYLQAVDVGYANFDAVAVSSDLPAFHVEQIAQVPKPEKFTPAMFHVEQNRLPSKDWLLNYKFYESRNTSTNLISQPWPTGYSCARLCSK